MLDGALAEAAIVATPHAGTIARLASTLEIDQRKTLKAMFFGLADGQILLAEIRGDLDVEVGKVEDIVGQPITGPPATRTSAPPGPSPVKPARLANRYELRRLRQACGC